MKSSLLAARVRSDVDVLSRAGLNLDDFIAEATESVQRAVPWVGACVGTHDPATMMLTSARKYGSLFANNDRDQLFGIIEYGYEDATSFRSLALAEARSVGVFHQTGGNPEKSERYAQLMSPIYGFGDEARLVFRDSAGFWGCLAIFRGSDEQPFDEEEIDYLGTLSETFARGVRAGMLARLAAVPPPEQTPSGPAVVILDGKNDIVQISLGASERMAELSWNDHSGDPLSLVTSLVAAARRAGTQPGSLLPRARVRTGSGVWLILHASPLSATDGHGGDVVVTIEEARPPEIVSLMVAAFGLTPRERDVTRLVLQGVDTREIAVTLNVSTYTVQDHLKSIFEKAGVRSRRELISRVYFDQYVPRMGADLAPGGWFIN